jgi:hypothetical protein
MSNNDTYRDYEGFGKPVEVEPRVWSSKGPDNEDHATGCTFIAVRGILPCTCDATRKEYSEWWKRWLRWQGARSVAYETMRPMPWPITGPDGEPWVPGIDFNDEETP